jgi:RNA polymerase sigma-70 factor, ECF subfamily
VKPRPTFADALEPHYEAALRYCRALCARSSPSDAEDVLQDALLSALRSYDQLREVEKFKPWLFTTITRAFHTHHRRSFWRRFVSFAEPAGERALPELFSRDPRIEDRLLLGGALATLSDRDRTVILLHEVAGFPLAEIASMCGDRSLSAVKSRLARARRRLREVLERRGERANEPGTRTSTDNASTPATELDYAY